MQITLSVRQLICFSKFLNKNKNWRIFKVLFCRNNSRTLIEFDQTIKKIINPSGGYPPDEIRFAANERRAPLLANEMTTLRIAGYSF